MVGVDVPDLLMGGEGVTSRALRFAAIVRAEGRSCGRWDGSMDVDWNCGLGGCRVPWGHEAQS